ESSKMPGGGSGQCTPPLRQESTHLFFVRAWRWLPQRLVLHHDNGAPRRVVSHLERRARHLELDRAAAAVRGRTGEPLEVRLAREASPERLPKGGDGQADVEVHEVLALNLVAPESPEVFRALVPRVDAKFGVDDDHTVAEAAQDVLEERVRAVQFVA